MADTTFVPGTTVTSTWLNDVNDYVYKAKTQRVWEFNVRDETYGAVGDNVTDDTNAIQSCIAAAQNFALLLSEGGVGVYIPNGRYKIDTGPLLITSSRVGLFGDGPSQSILATTLSTARVVKFQRAASASLLEGFMHDLKIESSNTNVTAGELVYLDNVIGGWFNNLKIDNGYDNLYCVGVNRCFFNDIILSDNGRLSGQTHSRISFVGSTTANLNSDVHLNNIQCLSNTGGTNTEYSIIMRAIDGIYIENSHFINNDVAVLLSPTNASGNTTMASVFFTNCYFDATDLGAHIEIQGTATSYRDIQISNCIFRASANDAIHFADLFIAPDLITITGCVFRDNDGTAIKCDETTFPPNLVNITGCIFSKNNNDAGAADGDIVIRGSYWNVGSNIFSEGNAAGNAVELRTEASNCKIFGNDFRASTAGNKIVDGGTNTAIGGNSGYVTKNRGGATIVNPATTITVNHGLSVTPTTSSIRLNLTNNATGVTRYWVSGITSTQFTINVDTTPAVQANFGWSADMET